MRKYLQEQTLSSHCFVKGLRAHENDISMYPVAFIDRLLHISCMQMNHVDLVSGLGGSRGASDTSPWRPLLEASSNHACDTLWGIHHCVLASKWGSLADIAPHHFHFTPQCNLILCYLYKVLEGWVPSMDMENCMKAPCVNRFIMIKIINKKKIGITAILYMVLNYWILT